MNDLSIRAAQVQLRASWRPLSLRSLLQSASPQAPSCSATAASSESPGHMQLMQTRHQLLQQSGLPAIRGRERWRHPVSGAVGESTRHDPDRLTRAPGRTGSILRAVNGSIAPEHDRNRSSIRWSRSPRPQGTAMVRVRQRPTPQETRGGDRRWQWSGALGGMQTPGREPD